MVPIDKAGVVVIAGGCCVEMPPRRASSGALPGQWQNNHRALRTDNDELKTVEADRQWVNGEEYFRSENSFQIMFLYSGVTEDCKG
ncbi:hypothetical protein MRBLMA1_002784 [Sphingobium sp. LMA1-1-1.1]|uniref:hypothetical protein n=1 Tax=Sphingobium sp. LMA1-1-1.1 TaxID=3135238 RepID=UPI003426C5C3